MNNEFLNILEKTLRFEGNYSNDSVDAGGETYKGISRVNFPNWEGWKIIDAYKKSKGFPNNLETNSELKKIVQEFYYNNFWLKLACDKINSILIAEELFDTAVNCGVSRAVEFLQRTLNILSNNGKFYSVVIIDGVMGEKTLTTLHKAISIRGEKLIYNLLNYYQASHYLRLMELNPVYQKYIGWFNRVNIIKT